MTKTAERRIELTLPMIPDVEIVAADAASELARDMGMSEDNIDAMSHAVIEACINAREHSYCSDQRIYLICVGVQDGPGSPKVEIWITDHGRGFDSEQARRVRMQTPSVPKKRGHGLRLIEAHMDEVEILSGESGTTVHMVKYGEKKEA
jgi:serine/threonine-protein kinase RsbW